MRGRAAVAAGGLCALTALAASAATAAPADAVAATRTAWWNEAPLGLVLSATPPQRDQLLVAEGTGRPDAVAALDYSVAGAPGVGPDLLGASATLTLTLDPASSVGTPVIVACPVLPSAAAWPAGGGQEGTPPASDCSSDRAVAGQVSQDGATVSFALTPAQQLTGHPGVFNLVVAPAGQVPFQAVFDPPGPAAFTVVQPAAPSSSPSSAAGGPAPAAGSAPSTQPSPSGGAGGGEPGAGTSFPDLGQGDLGGVSSLPAPAAPGPALSAPGPSPAGGGGTASGGPGRSPGRGSRPTVATSSPGGLFGGRRQQLLGVWLLVDAGLVLWLFGSDVERAPRLLGSLAGRRAGPSPSPDGVEGQGEVRGLGRFARARTGPPRRLY